MIFDNQYERQRIEKGALLKEAGKSPYPHNLTKELSTEEFKNRFAYVSEREEKRDETQEATVSGRVKFLRKMGKAAFAKIEDQEGVLQIYYSKDALGAEWFAQLKKILEVGDIVVVRGFPFVTKTGELSLHATSLEIATKAIKPLPEKFHGLQDIELRYRQRSLDMIMNPEVKEVLRIRSRIVSLIRHFFEGKGFLEVETPMMHPIAGGANARPFITHHNTLDVDLYLRIAPELYLKRLIVGGFESVFEINRNFRNEGMDQTHNPEFTMIEFYWAWHTYEDLMRLTEELFDYLFDALALPRTHTYAGQKIDFSTPFRKIGWVDALIEIGGVPQEIVQDREALLAFCEEKGIQVERSLSVAKLQTELFDELVEPKLIDPTFITHYPIEISPLARRNDADPEIADRFEFFIAGKEIANGFNELNDPIDQYERFLAQIEAKNAGDDEAHEMDEEYIHALGYGMPPTAGEGIGIDRLVMLLTDQPSIRDVIPFPAMKPLNKQEKKSDKEEA